MKQTNQSNAFHFKQFSIPKNSCGMQVSTDGVMLGAWMNGDQAQQILDIGCGTGLLSLMAAQRFADAHITAIDIAKDAIESAQTNVAHSPWSERIVVTRQDLLDPTFIGQFDHIVCNPPYFTSGASTNKLTRATARHAPDCFHDKLALRTGQLLTATGRASFILPTIEAQQMINYAQSIGLSLSRYCEVKTTPTKPVSRVLFELSKQENTNDDAEYLVIQENGHYSEAFIALTKNFYLKM